MAEKPINTVNFRKLLLNRCQKEFEKDKVDDVVFERKQKELDSAASVCGLLKSWLELLRKVFFFLFSKLPRACVCFMLTWVPSGDGA